MEQAAEKTMETGWGWRGPVRNKSADVVPMQQAVCEALDGAGRERGGARD